MIEFAPFQKYLKGKIKPDARQGTIDTSPEYKEFLDSLARPAPVEPVLTATEEEPKTTPLIEYLRTQKAAKAEKEKIQKEKMRVAKLAAAQAKANAAKLRAEKSQKAETGTNKPVETARDGKPTAARGGRGGKPGGKAKESQRSKQHPQPKNPAPSNPENPSAEPQAAPVETQNAPASSPIMSPSVTADVPNTGATSGQGFRGRGRGRARPHGVYRPGTGRGGRRGGNEGKPLATVAEG
jgi:regulator of nonsense transcripts 3